MCEIPNCRYCTLCTVHTTWHPGLGSVLAPVEPGSELPIKPPIHIDDFTEHRYARKPIAFLDPMRSYFGSNDVRHMLERREDDGGD